MTTPDPLDRRQVFDGTTWVPLPSIVSAADMNLLGPTQADVDAAYERGVAEGRRQATEGWAREWAVDCGDGRPVIDTEEHARCHAANSDSGCRAVSRLVGPWEAAEQAKPTDVEVFETRSAGWVVRCDPCDITNSELDEPTARRLAASHVAVKHAEQAKPTCTCPMIDVTVGGHAPSFVNGYDPACPACPNPYAKLVCDRPGCGCDLEHVL